MATPVTGSSSLTHIQTARIHIQTCFRRAHELLTVREYNLLKELDDIQNSYDREVASHQEELQGLEQSKRHLKGLLQDNNTLNKALAPITDKIEQIMKSAPVLPIIQFHWNTEFERYLENTGKIITAPQPAIRKHPILHSISPVISQSDLSPANSKSVLLPANSKSDLLPANSKSDLSSANYQSDLLPANSKSDLSSAFSQIVLSPISQSSNPQSILTPVISDYMNKSIPMISRDGDKEGSRVFRNKSNNQNDRSGNIYFGNRDSDQSGERNFGRNCDQGRDYFGRDRNQGGDQNFGRNRDQGVRNFGRDRDRYQGGDRNFGMYRGQGDRYFRRNRDQVGDRNFRKNPST